MKREIEIRCTGTELFRLDELTEFQSNLKTLSNDSAERLKNSLKKHGFFFPFYIWKNDGKNYFIDGHQRQHVLPLLAKEGWKLPEKYPVVFIEAKDAKEAAEAILLQSSYYGKIEDETLYDFLHSKELADDFPDLKLELDLPGIDLEGFELGWMKEGEVYDYSDLDKQLEDMEGLEDVNIMITVPLKYKEEIVDWLANGEQKTAPGLGKGIMKRCELL